MLFPPFSVTLKLLSNNIINMNDRSNDNISAEYLMMLMKATCRHLHVQALFELRQHKNGAKHKAILLTH